ncbi:MAG: histidine--tRNA ligase [Coriobacteriia bacterium]|nr:histidine--tRNA ligase [Coriobacteriia bacterium]
MALKAPRGTADLYGRQAQAWNSIRQAAFDFFAGYGYQPIETPTFEQLDVFVRGIGEATDVVGKEMFLVNDKNGLDRIAAGEKPGAGEQLALRPEMTAGVCRAVVEHNLVPPDATTVKLVYAATMYRHERPQKGRMREFHQIGAECLGAAEPSADAEVIVMLMRFFKGWGIPQQSMRLLINSMGDDACRPAFRDKVRSYILEHADSLCEDCVRRADTNPLRAFDCKNAACQAVLVDAPQITDELCEDCKTHYAAVKALLDGAGLTYEEDPRLVRGLDYYTRTVFEVQVTSGLGSQNAIGGGGRYDKLIQEFGGKPTPGLGFAVGFERMLMALEAVGTADFAVAAPEVFVAAVDEDMRFEAFGLAQKLRDAGVPVELDHQRRSLKSQFKQADKSGALFVVVVGPAELAEGKVTLRTLDTREEQQMTLSELIVCLKAFYRQ